MATVLCMHVANHTQLVWLIIPGVLASVLVNCEKGYLAALSSHAAARCVYWLHHHHLLQCWAVFWLKCGGAPIMCSCRALHPLCFATLCKSAHAVVARSAGLCCWYWWMCYWCTFLRYNVECCMWQMCSWLPLSGTGSTMTAIMLLRNRAVVQLFTPPLLWTAGRCNTCSKGTV